MLESIGLRFKPLSVPPSPQRKEGIASFASAVPKKKKNCVRGLSCGASCIAGSKICNKSLSQKQQAKVADLKKKAKAGDSKAQEQLGKIAQEQVDKQNRQAQRDVEKTNKSKGEDLTLEDLDKGDQELKQSLNRIGRASGDSIADIDKKWAEINRKSESSKQDLSLTELQLEDELASKRSNKSTPTPNKPGTVEDIKEGAVKRADRNYDRSLYSGDVQIVGEAGKQAIKARRQKYDDGTPRSIAPKEPSNDLNDKAFDRARKKAQAAAAAGDDIGALDAARDGIQALKRKYADTDSPAPANQNDDLAARRDRKLQLTNEVGLNLKSPETSAQKDITDATLNAIREGSGRSRAKLGATLEKYGIDDDSQIQSDIYQSPDFKSALVTAYKKLGKGDADKLAELHAQKLADSSEFSSRKLSAALVNAGIEQDVFSDRGGIADSKKFEEIVKKAIKKNING